MGQMVESLGFHPRTASASLTFFSVARALSRVGVGTLSDAVAGQIPRPAFLALSASIGIVAHGILAAATSLKAFVLGVILSGMAFGMI
jgi:sugar phosphate permease